MRLKIITEDKFVSIDDKGIYGVDMTWIPEFIGESGISTSVHAVQWYGDHGEIELNSRDNNIVITELGVLGEVVTKYEEKKLEMEEIRLEEIEQERLEQIRLEQIEQERLDQIRLNQIRLDQIRSEQIRLVGIQTTI